MVYRLYGGLPRRVAHRNSSSLRWDRPSPKRK
jgi:hypothetical protein